MTFDLNGYTTVNQRILTFYDLHPQGVISTHPAKVMDLGAAVFISVIAEVRTTPDAPPISAEAWEVYPGKTPYTRDSEMMNAATSAIGRALMQLGIGIDKAAASADEVQARAADRPNATAYNERQERRKEGSGHGDPMKPATEKQIAAVRRMMGAVPIDLRAQVLKIITGKDTFEALTNGDIQILFDGGKEMISNAENTAAELALKTLGDDPWAAEKW